MTDISQHTPININLENELNEVQCKAASTINGASLIIAGAGSGKTRTLTYRIAHMIAQGINPRSILALTFTNKAAKEMRERIREVVGGQNARQLWMGTFHSIFARILRQEPEATGFPSSFTIYDTTDSRSLIKSIIKELNYDDTRYKPNIVQSRISMAKNNLCTPNLYASNPQFAEEDRASGKPFISNIYSAYAAKCQIAKAMDFDDLLLNTNILFRDHPEVLEKYQNIFRYILVDEYQDTNQSQYLIVKKLAAKHGNLCVVGDDAQSIYAFRGARIENILNFKKDYPNYNEFKLEQNYRSTQNIVNAADSVIRKNSNQLQKQCFSRGEEGSKIGVIKAYTDQEEGYMVSNDIADTIRRYNAQYSDFAILYRTNAQSRIFEDALRRKSMPYKIYGGFSFYQRVEIKDFLAYLRLCVNHDDDEAFKRVINYPARGIGNTTIAHLQELATESNKSLFETIKSDKLLTTGIKAPAQKKLYQFAEFIASYTAKAFTIDAFDFAKELVLASQMLADLKRDDTQEGKSKYENIESLLNGIKEFCDTEKDNNEDNKNQIITITEYLENIALVTDTDNETEDDKNKISLMTVHQAKGLEYSYVYIAGMEENLFPSRVENMSLNDLEEERRLFYVALTRGKTRVSISFAQTRYRWGKQESNNVSRFAREIDEQYLEESLSADREQTSWANNSTNVRTTTKTSTAQPIINKTNIIKRPNLNQHQVTANFKPSNNNDIRLGMRIEHDRFGFGKVIDIEGDGPDGRMIVMFENSGKKTLIFKFAKVMIIK